jgi:hypothetical protein
MIYSVTKMTTLGNELCGVFSCFDEADGFVELNAVSGEDEQRYAIRGWIVDCPELADDEMSCPGTNDEDDDYDD